MSTEQPVTYALTVGGKSFLVREVTGFEAVSRPFRMTSRFALPPDRPIDPDGILRAEASIVIQREGNVDRRIDGVVTEASIEATVRGAPEVVVVIEPHLSLASHRADSRVFRDRTVPEIALEVLAEVDVVPELRLSRSYLRRAYCVQYQETDLDFVHRLLEDEGIFYYFLEGDGLVLGDAPAAYEPLEGGPAIPFRAASALDRQLEAIIEISDEAAMTAGRVTLRDFDADRPSADLTVGALVPALGDGPEFYDFSGEYTDADEGRHRAQVRAEAFACAAGGLRGTSTSGRLAPGRVLEIVGAPLDGYDTCVLTVVSHAYRRDAQGFSNAFGARPVEAPFRPPLATRVPLAPSLMVGVVTGPDGEDIHTDAMGRVKVHFPWDRRSSFDDSCSDWIPVLQDNTGSSSAIPRVGWEVLVSFLEGDPDRPVVLGRLYNGMDPFPEPLPAGMTRTSLRSLSSPSRAGMNMIRIDDAAGSEHIHVHAERDQNIVIGHDRHEDVLRDEMATVAGNESIVIGTDQITTIGRDHVATVEGSQLHAVAGRRTKDIGGAEAVTVTGSHDISVGVNHDRKIGSDDRVDASGIRDTVGGMILNKLGGSKMSGADAAMMVTVGGAFVEAAGLGKTESAKNRMEAIGGVVLTAARGGISESAGKARTTTVGGLFSASGAKGLVLKSGSTLGAEAGAMLKLTATKKLSLVVGDTEVVLEGANIEVKAATISITIDGQGSLDSDDSHLNS